MMVAKNEKNEVCKLFCIAIKKQKPSGENKRKTTFLSSKCYAVGMGMTCNVQVLHIHCSCLHDM